MPKVNDSQCPLGFHPQFRRPNYCKRCFREYNEHKSAKEGSSTSINSLSLERTSRGGLDRKDDSFGSKDSLVARNRHSDETENIYNSRTDLTSNSLSRSNSADEESGTWTKGRDLSWSAQDLRTAVKDAKVQVKANKEDVARHYGSTRSLTQDLGSLTSLLNALGSTSSLTKEIASPKLNGTSSDTSKSKSSFSSYLAMRTKSPARPVGSSPSKLEEISENSTSLLRSKSTKTESLTTVGTNAGTDGRPPKGPSRIVRARTSTLPELKESSYVPEPMVDRKKIIQCLREVKSEDTDATYVVKIKPKKKDKESSSTAATITTSSTLFGSIKKVEINLQPEIERLQNETKEQVKQIKDLGAKNYDLELENKELSSRKSRFGDIRKNTDAVKLQNKIDELNEEMKKKSREIRDAKKELDRRPLSKDIERALEDLRSKLQAAEQLCEELMDENEDYKKETRTLEDEIEEMQDNFREEQADEYRDLKRELEQRAKDCRVLQFKLKKAERRSDQMERDKSECEDKLKELQVGEADFDRAERAKCMEKELNLAKEVSMKMHEEMEKMKNQLEVAEIDKKKLKEKVLDTPVKPGTKVSVSAMQPRPVTIIITGPL